MTDEVRYRLRQQAAVAELGQRALVSTDVTRLMSESTALVAMGLSVEFCKVLELQPDGKSLLLKAGVGWKEGLVGSTTVGAGSDSQAGFTLQAHEPVIVEDLRSEKRFHGPPLLVEHGVVSGLSVIIQGKDGGYGVLGAHTQEKREFTTDDVNFMVAVANILAAAVERQRMENELKQAEERYRNIIENAAEGFFQTTPDGRPLMLNTAIARMSGFDSVDEAMANIDTVLSFYRDPADREAFIGKLNEEGAVKGFELHARRRDGSLAWFSVNARVVRDDKGEVQYIEGFVEDITGRREFEDALKESEERYRALVETSADAIVYTGLDTKIILCNQGAAQILGYDSADDLLGKKVVNLVVLDEKKRALKVLKELIATGRTVNREFDFKRADGSNVPVEINASLLRNKHGRPRAIVGMGRDISQRKQTEEVLRNTAEGVSGVTGEAFFRTLVEYLARALDMDFAFIGEMIEEKEIRTIAVIKDGEIIENFDYDLHGTPCHNVVRNGVCSYTKNVARKFPKDRMLADMEIESYIGTPLTDSSGHVQGVMSVLGRKPIENTELAESMLRIFAVRASAELERKQAEEELRLLHTLTSTINEAETLDDALEITVKNICDVTGWLLGEVWMPSADGAELQKSISWHEIDNGFRKFNHESEAFSFKPGEGLPGRVWEEKQPVWLKDVTKYKDFRRMKIAKKIGIKAGVGIPVMLNGEVIAVMNFFIKEAREQEERFIELVSTAAGQLGSVIQKKRADEKVKDSVQRLQSALSGVIGALASTVERRDPYTAGHQQRVAKLGAALAEEMGLLEESVEGLRMAGTLHDLGKIAVPAEILSKPGTISEYEFSIIKNHPQVGYEILREIEFPWDIARIVHEHHERFNGSGYPQGLSGKDIMLEARIMAVADTVEAMASHRPYRPSLGLKAAIEEIQKYRGSLFDPDAVDACIRLFEEKGYQL